MRTGKLSRFHILTALAIALCVVVPMWWLVVAVYIVVVALGVTFPQWQLFGPSRCCVVTNEKVVALTFDDGPDPEVTPALLAVLEEAGIRAVFFCVGQRVAQHPELARQIVAAGHLLGNHSHAHRYTTNLLSRRQLEADLSRAQEEIGRCTGVRPTLFRSPMGLTNPRLFRVLAHLNLPMIGWTVRGRDKGAASPAVIVRRIRRGVRPGAIILLHDGGATGNVLLPAVRQLIGELKDQGFRIVRLDEMLAMEQ